MAKKPPVPGATKKGGLGTKGKKGKSAGNNGNMMTGFLGKGKC